jgi:hypothetical protein
MSKVGPEDGDAQESAADAAAREAIDDGNRHYSRAFIESDAEVARASLSPEVILVDPEGIIAGWDAFVAEIAHSREHHRVLEFSIMPSSMQRLDDEAYVRGRYRFVFQSGEDEPRAYEGSFVQIWRNDGSWRLWRDITVDRQRVLGARWDQAAVRQP